MPDLQYSATRNDTMVNIRDHVLPLKCEYIEVIVHGKPLINIQTVSFRTTS